MPDFKVFVPPQALKGHEWTHELKGTSVKIDVLNGRVRIYSDLNAQVVESLPCTVVHMGDKIHIALDRAVPVIAQLFALGGLRDRNLVLREEVPLAIPASELCGRTPDTESSDGLRQLIDLPPSVKCHEGPVSFIWDPADLDDPKQVGLIPDKYRVLKGDGSPVDPGARYFVLRLDNACDDPVHLNACRTAARVYAACVRASNPKLAADLEETYGDTTLEIPFVLGDDKPEMAGSVQFYPGAVVVSRDEEPVELVQVNPADTTLSVNDHWVEIPHPKKATS